MTIDVLSKLKEEKKLKYRQMRPTHWKFCLQIWETRTSLGIPVEEEVREKGEWGALAGCLLQGQLMSPGQKLSHHRPQPLLSGFVPSCDMDFDN